MSTLDLDTYLPAIAAGDLTAFAQFLAAAEPPLRRALTSFAADVDVEAVVQETLLRIWQVAPTFTADGRPHALQRFGHRCARNLCLSELRRRRLAPTFGDDAAVDRAEDPTAAAPPDPLLRRAVQECREKLPAKPGQALTARLDAAGDADDRTLAARLGMTLNTFLQNFTRARQLLAECLRRRGVEAHYLGGAP
ncbi:MAG: sigma-70 family RNA polymerase sigma factor [Kofleriaceae bacterium]